MSKRIQKPTRKTVDFGEFHDFVETYKDTDEWRILSYSQKIQIMLRDLKGYVENAE